MKPKSSLRVMTENDLECVLSWRNHSDVRRYMYNQHIISLEEHTRWFERASVDQNKHLLIYERDQEPLGFLNINESDNTGIADWGFYVVPGAEKGTGSQLGQMALHYAFIIKKLHKLCGQTLGFNHRSIAFHLKLGFTKEGTLREQHFDGQQYQDVICFGLLAHEWKSNQQRTK